jgi:hypothetical protein
LEIKGALSEVEYVLFVIGSSFEYFAYFIFMFTLFRFRIKPRMIGMTLLIALLMSQISYVTRLNPNLSELSSYIQLVLLVVWLCLLFRVPLFYSIIMNFAGFVAGFVLQGIVVSGLMFLLGLTLADMQNNQRIIASIQVLTAILELTICRLLYVMNWNFDFVPTSHRADVRFSGTNAILLSTIVLCISLAAIAAYLLRDKFGSYFVVSYIVFFVTLPIFLYYLLRKDYEDAS